MKIVALVFFLLFLLAGFLMFKLFLKIVKKSVQKRKADVFTGTVTDKKEYEDEDEDSHIKDYHYYLYFKTDAGKEVKYSVAKDIYDSFEVGDKVEKKVGEMIPVKV